jgi:hypothetical protein
MSGRPTGPDEEGDDVCLSSDSTHGNVHNSAPCPKSLLVDLFRNLFCNDFVPLRAGSVGPSCGSGIYVSGALYRGRRVAVFPHVLPSHGLARVPFVRFGEARSKRALPTFQRSVLRRYLRQRVATDSCVIAVLLAVVLSRVGGSDVVAQGD